MAKYIGYNYLTLTNFHLVRFKLHSNKHTLDVNRDTSFNELHRDPLCKSGRLAISKVNAISIAAILVKYSMYC